MKPFACLPAGAIALLAACSGTVNQAPATADPPPPPVLCTPAPTEEIHHLIAYGQSLSLGAAALPALTTSARHDSLRFGGGVRPQDAGNSVQARYGALVPLIETENGVFGETPVAGALEQINDLIEAEDGIAYTQSPQRYLGSAPGMGARRLSDLARGTDFYARLLQNVVQGQNQAGCRPYDLRAVFWLQGEADYLEGTGQATYLSQLKSLQADLETDAAAITGQSAPLPLISYQVASHAANGATHPGIALAQWQASRQSARIHIAAPAYPFDYSDEVHFTAASSKAIGAYLGLAYKRLVVDGMDWRPLEPLDLTLINPVTLEVRFHVPVPPLVLDAVTVSDPGASGFSLLGAGGAMIPITDVAVSAPDRVRLTTAAPIVGEATLRYAFEGGTQSGRMTGPRGNLRDSQGDSLVFDPSGIARPMHNWCVIFELPVP